MLKESIRKTVKDFRYNLSSVEKNSKDELIYEKVINLIQFQKSDIVLCYYSTEFEIDTVRLIEYSLNLNKKVALPKCINSSGEMVFKYINSLQDLKQGYFGLSEPHEDLCDYSFDNDTNSICIIPALSVDKKGYRIGYGKGYYDRFLTNYNGFKCVLCYKENVVDALPIYDGFDVKCDLFITD